MLQRMTFSRVAIAGLVVWTTAQSLGAAEFRTSVNGKRVVRQATYQTPTPAEPAPSVLAVPDSPSPTLRGPRVDATMDPMGVGAEPYWEPNAGEYDTACGTACDNTACDWGDCGPCPRWSCWGSFEFLIWWRKDQELPPLVTTSPVGTASDVAGVLGEPTTQVLYPTDQQGSDARPGARLALGVWFDSCQISGLGGRFFSLGSMTASSDTDSDTFPILARPFFNLTLSQEDADVVAFPEFTTGRILVRSESDVSGGDAFFRRMLFRDTCRRIDVVGGYQFAAIDGSVRIESNRRSIRQEGSVPFGTVIDMYDSFDCTNRYHAGEIGLLAEYEREHLTWSLLAKVGLGTMNQRSTITGQTAVAVPGQPVVTSNVGLLALGTNIGIYEQNQFTVSPELQLSAAYHLNDCVDLTCGYSFVYWNHVAQPGLEIDRVINSSQIEGALVGDARPAFLNEDTGYFVHGLSFGVQFVW